MITDLKQLVVQEEALSGEKRVFAQFGDITNLQQISVGYADLTPQEQAIWDDFVNLIKSKG